MKIRLLALLSLALIPSCARTNLYHKGECVASFQGDMKNLSFELKPDGTATWTATEIKHSTATEAQGRQTARKFDAFGTAGIGAGIMALFK